MVIYKYCKNSKYTKDLIENQNLFFSKASQFNDPYDCMFKVEFKGNTEMFYKFIERANSRMPTAQKFLLEQIASDKNYFEKHSDFFNSQFLQALYQEQIQNNYIISCFTEDYKNRLMWSHYSDYHRGVVIALSTVRLDDDEYLELDDSVNFNISNPYDNNLYIPVYKVRYREQLFTANPLDHDQDWIQNVYCRKDSVWKYEKEWRCFLHYEGFQICKLKNSIKDIYLGARMKSEEIQEYVELVARIHKECGVSIDVYRMEVDRNSYRLFPVPLIIKNKIMTEDVMLKRD